MDNAFVVRRRQAQGDLGGVVNRLPERQRTGAQAVAQALAFQQLADDIGRAIGLPQVINRKDVGMVERGRGARLLLEAAQALGVSRELRWQYLDGNLAPKARVARAIDLTHSPRADRAEDFVGAERGADTSHFSPCSDGLLAWQPLFAHAYTPDQAELAMVLSLNY